MSPSTDPEVKKVRLHQYHIDHRDEILARQRIRRAIPEVKIKDRATVDAWRVANRAKILVQGRKRNMERQQRFLDYKDTLACTHCGLTGGHLICFHHCDPSTKEYNIALLAQTSFNTPKFWTEIAKCIPLCHNCHATLHHEECRGELK